MGREKEVHAREQGWMELYVHSKVQVAGVVRGRQGRGVSGLGGG